MRITIQIVTWSSAKQLPRLLDSLKTIPAGEVEITVIDNASTDSSVSLVQTALPNAHIIQLRSNTGFCSAHNVGFAAAKTEFVLIVNPDLQLRWEGVQKVLEVFSDSKVAAVQGKLLRSENPSIIDSAGIEQTLSLNGKERGAGEQDSGQYNAQAELLATTGACSLFRMSALKSIAHGTYGVEGHEALEVFDKDFFAYKEDIDLGWRFKNAGYKNMYVPVLVGIHPRSIRSGGVAGFLARLKDERTKLSLRNYMLMVHKNASVKQKLLHELFIESRLLVFVVISLLYWPLFGVMKDVKRLLPIVKTKVT